MPYVSLQFLMNKFSTSTMDLSSHFADSVDSLVRLQMHMHICTHVDGEFGVYQYSLKRVKFRLLVNTFEVPVAYQNICFFFPF